eukprot:1091604-Rhodomonas_salina.1
MMLMMMMMTTTINHDDDDDDDDDALSMLLLLLMIISDADKHRARRRVCVPERGGSVGARAEPRQEGRGRCRTARAPRLPQAGQSLAQQGPGFKFALARPGEMMMVTVALLAPESIPFDRLFRTLCTGIAFDFAPFAPPSQEKRKLSKMLRELEKRTVRNQLQKASFQYTLEEGYQVSDLISRRAIQYRRSLEAAACVT